MTRRLAALLAFSTVAAPMNLSAQAVCKWSASDAWVKRQAEFFDESKHDWTNDSLRTALLSAAGLTAPLKMPVNLGVQIEGRDAALGANADEMVAQLKKMATQRGSPWPTRGVVGPAG